MLSADVVRSARNSKISILSMSLEAKDNALAINIKG